MTEVLGRVTNRIAEKRGPDAFHRIGVLEPWLRNGETIEVDLPRNLACANCDGGGCDLCDRAGATSLRGRKDPPESLEVTLPARDNLSQGTSVVLRIPERGGLSNDPSVAARGVLLLRVEVVPEAGGDVRLLKPQRMSLVDLAVSKQAPPLVRIGVLIAAGILLWLVAAILFHFLG